MVTTDGIGTVSWLEMGFLVVGTLGIARTLFGFFRWRREDRLRVRKGLNGRLRILYRGKMRLYAFCAIKMGIYFSLAALSAVLPPYGTPLAAMTPFQQLIARHTPSISPALLTLSALILFLIPLYEERDRGAMEAADELEMVSDVRAALEEEDG